LGAEVNGEQVAVKRLSYDQPRRRSVYCLRGGHITITDAHPNSGDAHGIVLGPCDCHANDAPTSDADASDNDTHATDAADGATDAADAGDGASA